MVRINEVFGVIVLTIFMIHFFAFRIYVSPQFSSIQEKRIAGLRTSGLSSQQIDHRSSIRELTQGDNIGICLVHFDIIFRSPAQADICPGLEPFEFSPKQFPFCHEYLKIADRA
jgi:hypothetical protein